MKTILSRFFADYGMLVPFFMVCAVVSVLTLGDQYPTGDAAAQQTVAAIMRKFPDSPRVLIAVRIQTDDLAFAKMLEGELNSRGAKVVGVVQGEPKDARTMLRKVAESGDKLDVIACTAATGEWIVFSDLKGDFPTLGDPWVSRLVAHRWPSFLMPDNLRNIANQIAVIAILAIGMTIVIITGGIDLSVGSLIALSAVLAAYFIREFAGSLEASAMGMTVACVAAILISGIVGAFTGAIITRFDVQPFIVTLTMMLVCRGAARIVAKGESIHEIPASVRRLALGADVLRIPNPVLVMIVLYAAAHILMSRMRLGRYLYAVGGNREAARLSGVPVRRVLMFAYIASSLLAGLGGVILASQFKSGSPNYGMMYEFYVIAAVVVGGASLSGGEGKMFGTLIGAFTIAVIENGMNLTNVEPDTQMIVLGLVILAAVLIDKIRRRSGA